ncbi:MAG: MarR family winged helix-turn-helix transcriptional regulator [Candidatus Promineifilaceae bacterium]|jgi:DNA-binding MarR family transcriptional regulator
MTAPPFDLDRREKWLALMQELNSDVDPNIVRLLERMRMVSHSLYQLGEQSLEQAGLSYARFRLLMNLYKSEEMDGRSELNPSEISTRQGISRNTVSTLIRDLEDEGLIERRLDPDDRRRFNIRLTEDGRNLVRRHSAAHFRAVAGCFDALSPEQQQALSSTLNVLGENIDAARKQCLHE